MSHLLYSLRQLVRRPGFSVLVIVMLALGVGASSAMFAAFDQILLQSLRRE